MTDDKENTWRALQGEPLLMRWSCRFGIHKWTKWTEEEHSYAGNTYIKLTRRCAGCNLPQTKLIKDKRWI